MRLHWYIISALLATVLITPHVTASAMTVEEAYMTLSHQRPIFNPSIAKMADDESLYLRQLFQIIDQAVRERVQTMAWLQSATANTEPPDQYNDLLSHLSALRPPHRLNAVHQLLREAIEEQRDVLREWRPLHGIAPHAMSMQHPLVQDSSRKLYQVYDEVLRLFPGEDQRNRQAFHDYFCCLDLL